MTLELEPRYLVGTMSLNLESRVLSRVGTENLDLEPKVETWNQTLNRQF